MEKTLIIHPDDRSTDFLKPIYASIEKATIITGGKSKNEVVELIEQHDRTIILGHGSPNGLFAMRQFNCTEAMIIDHTMVPSLGVGKNNIYIWCNADQFVNRYHLKGFYSGMFISEYIEAIGCGVPTLEENVEDSNKLFADIVGKSVIMESKNICNNTKVLYYIPNNKIVQYNNKRLYWR